MKRVLVAIAVLTALGSAGSAHAVPDADQMSGARATLRLVGSGGAELHVEVAARVSEAGTRAGTGDVVVAVRQCRDGSCSAPLQYRARMAEGDLSVAGDRSSATLRTALFGHPLELVWHTPSDETSVDGKAELYSPVLPEGRVRVWAGQSRESQVSATLLGVRCPGRAGVVYTEQLVDGVDDAVSPRLPTALPQQLAAMRRPACR